MKTVYEQTEYDRITPPIRDRYKRISKERGVKVVPLAVGEAPPKKADKKKAVDGE